MGKTVGSAWEESWTKLWVRRPHIGTFYGPILPSVKQSFPKIRSHWDRLIRNELLEISRIKRKQKKKALLEFGDI